MKYRKKPVVIDATQWFKNGDHPKDDTETFCVDGGEPFQGEGHIVRYYRRPECDGGRDCERCDKIMQLQGWIET